LLGPRLLERVNRLLNGSVEPLHGREVNGILANVLERLNGVRKSGRGWTARCPAHGDRHPSLSICTGRQGAVLLKCFAGCTALEIVTAIGLALRDLFPQNDRRDEPPSSHTPAKSREELRETLTRHIEEARAERLSDRPWDTPHIRSADVNRAIERTKALCGAQLRRVDAFAWETCAPHDQDPIWPFCLERAASEQFFTATPFDRIATEDRAAEILHEIARSTACP